MITLNPEQIHYACIARATTILGHHLPVDDPNIETLASQCIAQVPPNHSLFTHTVKNRTYTFLIEPPFVFFAIFDQQFLKSHALRFLERLCSQFQNLLKSQTNHDFAHLSFQHQFDSIFREAIHGDSPNGAVCRTPKVDYSSKGNRLATVPLLEKPSEGLKKKKRVVGVEANGGVIDCKEGGTEKKVEVCDEVNGCGGRDFSLAVPKGLVNDRQKAKHIWKKHVWVVLLLDLFVCAVLFVIWLWVCSGFKCMAY